MYVPKHIHMVGPVSVVLVWFAIWTKYPTFEVIFMAYPLFDIARYWAKYIAEGGVAYQNYITNVDAVVTRHAAQYKDLGTEQPTAANSEMPKTSVYETASVYPKFDKMRNFCRTQMVMRDHMNKPHGDYRESIWVGQNKFSRDELKGALEILEFAGGIHRVGVRKNATYQTKDWRVIELGAAGQPLPQPNKTQ